MPTCPYCEAVDQQCSHLMLVVDLTFKSVAGGFLYELATSRLDSLSENDGDEEDSSTFDQFLDEMSRLSTTEEYYENDFGPGASSSNVNFYCENAQSITNAYLALF